MRLESSRLSPCKDVVAVIVTFNPELPRLESLVRRLSPQVNEMIIVDNGSVADLAEWQARSNLPALTIHLVGENRGIAAAQNIGITMALARNAQFVLLSDQDSEPAESMVSTLRQAARSLMSEAIKLAAVGPTFFDMQRGEESPFFRTNGWRIDRVRCQAIESVVETDYLIASGCLIPADAIRTIGNMNEELFIDYVDIEWCQRAKLAGYKSYGVCAARMSHALGDRSIAVLGRARTSHSPIRDYYFFRNAVWLYKQRNLATSWKIADARRICRRLVFAIVFSKPQLTRVRMIALGMVHGIRSRLGRY